jgi:hypothetical protein
MWRFLVQLSAGFVLCTAQAYPIDAIAKTLDGQGFSFTYDEMTDQEAASIFSRAQEAYPAIISYLGLTTAPQIVINDYNGGELAKGETRIETVPSGAGETAAAPATAGPVRISIPVRYMRQKRFNTAVVHEMTHALAGAPADKNLFLAEGLAVHVHGVLSREDEAESFANFPIHRIANRILQRFERTDLVHRLYDKPSIFTSANDKPGDGINAAVGYAVAGSFVTWLVQRNGPAGEKKGVADFMRIYRGASFHDVYGQSLRELEAEWVRFVAAEPQPDYYYRPGTKPAYEKPAPKKVKSRSS